MTLDSFPKANYNGQSIPANSFAQEFTTDPNEIFTVGRLPIARNRIRKSISMNVLASRSRKHKQHRYASDAVKSSKENRRRCKRRGAPGVMNGESEGVKGLLRDLLTPNTKRKAFATRNNIMPSESYDDLPSPTSASTAV